MAPSILAIGLPASSPLVPEHLKESVEKALNDMNAQMEASPYAWEFFVLTPDSDFSSLAKKLHEKKWDVVLLGAGLRTINSITPFFEKIVNTVHKELPGTKFAFNEAIDKTLEACQRALGEA